MFFRPLALLIFVTLLSFHPSLSKAQGGDAQSKFGQAIVNSADALMNTPKSSK